jgi:hypothetical protein
MNAEEAVIEKLRSLSPEEQQEVLDFVEQILRRKGERAPRRDLIGMFSHLGITFTEEDIAKARREMWGNFPRNFPE